MTPSHYQQAIYDHASDGVASAIVEAVAGSGKSHTSIGVMNLFRGGTYIAFNKSIQVEMEPKVARGWQARTFNSLGFQSCRTMPSRPDLNTRRGKGGKVWQTCQRIPNNYKESRAGAAQAISMAKSFGFGVEDCIPNERANWLSLLQANNFDIKKDHREKILSLLPDLYEANTSDRSEIDFDDQVLYTLMHDLPTLKFKRIIVDESQDMSILQQYLLLKKLLHENGRIFMFGDTYQSIYAFRGADSSAMRHAASLFKAISLPLSISYRCPTDVVNLAQGICPHILARPNAPTGAVRHPLEDLDPHDVAPDGLVICRTNAPLLGVALKFLVAGLPCRMRNNIGKRLEFFVKNFKTDDLKIFRQRLDSWRETELADARSNNLHARAAYIIDTWECFDTVLTSPPKPLTSVQDLLRLLASIFTKTTGPIVSTIHKAKGLESPDVHFIRTDLIPSKWASEPWEIQQENNLLYVGWTRSAARLSLYAEVEED